MVTYYNTKDLKKFGEYLLSDERKQRTSKINRQNVTHADVESWKGTLKDSRISGKDLILVEQRENRLKREGSDMVFQAGKINVEYAKDERSCPNCGGILFDSNPEVICTSYPAKKEVACKECDYKGYQTI